MVVAIDDPDGYSDIDYVNSSKKKNFFNGSLVGNVCDYQFIEVEYRWDPSWIMNYIDVIQ